MIWKLVGEIICSFQMQKAESTNYLIRGYEAFAPFVAGAMFTISMCVTPADGVWMSVSA